MTSDAPAQAGPAAPGGATAGVASRADRLRRPLLAAGGLLAGTVAVAFVDPHRPGHYPLCPFRALTGLDCPLCGSLRATHDLAHGQVVTAASENLLLVLAAPLLALGWLVWLRRSWSGERPVAVVATTRAQLLVVALLVVFMLVRNTPWGHWFASTP